MLKSIRLLAAIALAAMFGTSVFAQVGQPSQISIQGTALITKSTDANGSTYDPTKSGGLLVGYSYQFSRWAGAEANYGYSRNTQNYFSPARTSSLQAAFHEVTGAFG